MRIRTTFVSSEKTGLFSELEIFTTNRGEIFLQITNPEEPALGTPFVCLDKKTAIQFSRVLKREISFLREEADNG